jgi:fatty-acyl-CoA synthase
MAPNDGTRPDALPSRQASLERLAALGARIEARTRVATLPQWWEERVSLHPDHVVLRTPTRTLSYRELDQLSDRVARAAYAEGVRPGDAVGLQLPASGVFLALILGLAKAGARLALLSPGLRGRSLRHALTEIPTTLLITSGEGARAAAALEDFSPPRIVVLDDPEAAARAPTEPPLEVLERWLEPFPVAVERLPPTPARSPDETLFYIFTSGTTGLPKATQCSHLRYVAGATSEGALFEMTDADRMYVVLPMFHIAALSAIGAALSVCASVVIRSKFSASAFWQDVHAYSATTFQYLGEILRYLIAQPSSPLDRPNPLRALLGAGVTEEVWLRFEQRFGPVQIVESYGSSEGVIGIFNADGVPGSVGRAAPSLEERLEIVTYDVGADRLARDPEGRLIACAEGEPGELLARLDDRNQFEGYSSAEATRSKLLEDAFEDGDGRALLTETYKIGVAELKRQGYATEEAEDPVYLLDARAGRYAPVTDASLREARLPPFQGETAGPTP